MVDDFTSFIWRRKYYSCGDFELHCPAERYEILSHGKYIMRNDTQELAVCESITLSKDSVEVSGRFLESILSYRVISSKQDFEDQTQGSIACSLVESFCPAVTVRASELGSPASVQITEQNLMDYTYELLQEAELSQRVKYENGAFFYEVWQGLDRTQDQSANPWAVFSPDWDNLISLDYAYSSKEYKNYAYVAGEGEDPDREVVEVDLSGGKTRREIWIDANDIRRDDMTLDEYRKKLTQRGKEKLTEYAPTEKVDAQIYAAAMGYRVDYDLGDICTITSPEYSLTVQKRIESIEEIYENGAQKINVTFGKGFLLLPDYIKRELS